MSSLIHLIFFSVLLTGCNNGYKAIDPNIDLGQNWSNEDQKIFYQTTQGSQIMPYTWFLSLEQADRQTLFLADKLQRFGYLPDIIPSNPQYNPDQLPVGFVRDNDEHGVWIGMTCAACHTAELLIDGKPARVDGAATQADFVGFIKALSQALSKTATDPEKFTRFYQRVAEHSTRLNLAVPNKADLWQSLSLQAQQFHLFYQRNRPDLEVDSFGTAEFANIPGFARLDAFGFIINEVAYNLLPIEQNLKIPNAPVSYPFIWDTDQQKRVQWNGVSNGALSRNTTEVLGVFAKFNPHKPSDNTVNLDNLRLLQKQVRQLRSPRWEDKKFGLPAIDQDPERKARGKRLYERHCQRCHQVLDRNADQVGNVPVTLNHIGPENLALSQLQGKTEPIDTDPLMAQSFVQRTIQIEADEPDVPVPDALASLLPKTWFKSFPALLAGVKQALLGVNTDDLLVYKARPLNGVWATAPYLHNGSVPDMLALLKPAEERPVKFCVGSRNFYPVTLGFESTPDASGDCGAHFLFDTQITGNSNQGHEYGTINDPNVMNGSKTALSEQDRMDIIEFIKAE